MIFALQLEVQLKEHEAASRAQIKEQLDHDRQEAESAIAAYQAAQKVEIDKVICSRLAALEQERRSLRSIAPTYRNLGTSSS